VLEQRLDGVVVLRRGGGGWGARAARVWSEKERGDRAAMAALIAVRERERRGPGRIHAEEGEERGSRCGRRVVWRRLRHAAVGRG
jgi:hypothetical protein